VKGLSSHFLHIFYELFLLLFRAQLEYLLTPIIQTVPLQCYPHVQSPNGISLAYSSSNLTGLKPQDA